MPLPALLLLLAVLLPLASFVVLVFIGKRMGNPLAGWFATLAIGTSFVCSIAAMVSWLGQPDGSPWGYGIRPINLLYPWVPTGAGLSQHTPGFLDLGIYVDSVTILMFAMITGIASLVHLFSIGYMHEDKRFPRFFTYLGLFCFSMLGLVLGGTVLHLFIFWELVGLCSYLLIGFWYEKKSASNAAIKAFVVNRIGDFGFLIGFGILFYHVGNVALPDLWKLLGTAGTGQAITLANGAVFSPTLLTIMGIGLFFGAVGKSAQFPLHVWLPDAMEGPTPVSALIHAATMVAAGVYLVARIFPILSPDAKLFIAIIGCTTLTMAALIAMAQTDIKKVLAYSTLSQLGYMILAMGVGSWVGGLFHLITHAFFKALLFLGSGSVIHAAHHEQELPQYGGLLRKLPVTGATFLVACFAISGFGVFGWGFSGFYSKDLILEHAAAFGVLSGHGRDASAGFNMYWLLFILPACIAYVTPFYMMRCWTLTFWGKPRNKHVYDHAHETTILWIPLVVLAIASIFGGRYMLVRDLVEAGRKEIVASVGHNVFAQAWPYVSNVPADGGETRGERIERRMTEGGAGSAEGALITQPKPGSELALAPGGEPSANTEEVLEHGKHTMHAALANGWAWLIGMGAGFLVYMNGYVVANRVMGIPGMRAINTWLLRRMYFDELYNFVFVSIVMAFSALCAWFDKWIIDGIVNGMAWLVKQSSFLAGANDKYIVDGAVNGAATLAQNLGSAVRAPQTGRIRMYVTVLMIAVTLGLAGTIIIVLSR
ncbi:NADH-quinone oxidoreductase subunit L [soil metagenome]